MTSTQQGESWWDTTWGQLQPGDMVKAPDGSRWSLQGITAAGSSDLYEFIGASGSVVRTKQDFDAPCVATRPAPAPVSPELARAAHLLMGTLGATVVAPEPRRRRAPALKWIKCGATGECKCKR